MTPSDACGTSPTQTHAPPEKIITDIYAALDQPARIAVLNKPMLRAIGLFNRNVHELLSTYYQFDAPFIADHTVFASAFGGHITDWNEIIHTTIESYRHPAPAQADVATTEAPRVQWRLGSPNSGCCWALI